MFEVEKRKGKERSIILFSCILYNDGVLYTREDFLNSKLVV